MTNNSAKTAAEIAAEKLLKITYPQREKSLSGFIKCFRGIYICYGLRITNERGREAVAEQLNSHCQVERGNS
jgi:hypothetical protein